jgi:hypothetical protein
MQLPARHISAWKVRARRQQVAVLGGNLHRNYRPSDTLKWGPITFLRSLDFALVNIKMTDTVSLIDARRKPSTAVEELCY